MRRVLVPLDGSRLAETILPDALRIAGPEGELILVRDAGWAHVNEHLEEYGEWHAIEETERYLASTVAGLEAVGRRATAYRLTASDIAAAIDNSASYLDVDMVACATHGRGPLGRLLFGGIVWKALAESHLPILLRHSGEDQREEPASKEVSGEVDVSARSTAVLPCGVRESEEMQRRIMLPLDGSRFAEAAIPMAEALASEWKESLYLVRVVPAPSITDSLFGGRGEVRDEIANARAYLGDVGGRLTGDVHIDVFTGSPVDRLVDAVADRGITDIVMTSHGRTGLTRVLFGSVTDELIQRVRCPTVVIPPLATEPASQVAETVQPGEKVCLT